MAKVSLSYITARVAERVFRGSDRYDGKHVGKDCRLQWSRFHWVLEELPQKGKKKLKSGTLRNPSADGYLDPYLAGNILQDAKLTAGDDYGAIKKKLKAAYAEAWENAKTTKNERLKRLVDDGKLDWVKDVDWYENDVFYLNVVPEGVDPFTAGGKDFTMKVEWTKFEAYSPQSDFQQSDPYYIYYSAASPTSARQLFVMLKSDPKALKSIAWSDLGSWLTSKKIKYKSNHSQWT